MGKLTYTALASLDGYVADESGKFDWAMPDEEVHGFVNDLEQSVGTFLLGRKMYEVLLYWETAPTDESEPTVMRDYAAIWRRADKVVYSKTLQSVSSARTRIERSFDVEAVRRLKASAAREISIGGPELAGQALKAGLVDECHLLLSPVIVGGGNRCLPGGVRVNLELADERRFGNGTVYLHYRVRPQE